MTSRERILTALAHRTPDRVPFSWGFGTTPEMGRTMAAYCSARKLDWDRLRAAATDIAHCGPAYAGPPPAGGNTYVGIWGIRTKAQGYGGGEYAEFTDFPLAGVDDRGALDAYPWPSPDHYDYSGIPAAIAGNAAGPRRAMQCAAGNPFETYCWMTGLEESLVNVLVRPDLVRAALGFITGFFEERLRRTLAAAGGAVDIVFLADDLGGQNGLLMSREAYRAVLQPFHRRLADCARRHAPEARTMLHSDGAVFDILPDVMDAGVEVLEAVQVDAAGMEPGRLKAAYGDRLSFHGAVSVQQLLPHSDAAGVTRECRRLVKVLGRGGGYIAAPSHAIQVGTPPENVMAMLETLLGPDAYAVALDAARAGG